MSMPELARITDETELAEAVSAAAAEAATLEIVAGGSKRALGRAGQTARTLDVSGLSGLTLYEPEELVLSAKAGTPLADIEDLLARHQQMLAFEPVDLGPLYGGPSGAGSVGGMFACNLSGPRRLSHGAVRDHALGARAVSGRGELFKSGGRVVKNVTGYDLPRLLAGSFGTLAVLSEITLKVLPRPAMQETLLVFGLGPDAAARAMSAAMGSSCEVSGAAALPASIVRRCPEIPAEVSVVAFRLEGFEPSVRARRAMLITAMSSFGAVEVLEADASAALWDMVRNALPFAGTGMRAVWRLSTSPMAGPVLAEAMMRALDAEAYCDWAGGLVWALMPAEAAEPDAVREMLRPHGGHATLIRGTPAERAGAVFQPLEGALDALTRRVKAGFDPLAILNPGRMHAGM
ncbi:glycolate oxidase subunit GlcE [Aquabacter spiritensis]|uniref:Glycolate oxidase FAD binding subunit n=1 Tax=Aquabacter spiritensis TaxID=933073 RepID=A0A4R3M0W4_9HYPH|nr:glycolate oxidase subunit GlcE [Aquabacter spiritensis]TCT06731.1 glycolate oxidase FAD binding subunit [Aquabacter spiritensis]